MDTWDEEKLRKVVNSKGNPRTTTDVCRYDVYVSLVLICFYQIVCKYFIDAIETQR